MKSLLRGLIKFVALVLASGAVGVALGIGLSRLSDEDTPATPVPDSGAGEAGSRATGIATVPPAANPTAPTTAPATATAPPATTTATDTATTATDPQAPRARARARVRVSVLDARLFTDSTPSGVREQRARVTVRIRADNAGGRRVTLDPPTLRVGSVRIPTDPNAAAGGATFDPLGAGASQTVTLRFALEGEATPKVVRDRRARILIAGQSLPMRVRVQAPTR